MMSSGEGTSLVEHFSSLEDPRRPQGRRHNLLDIITMTICGLVAGAEGWDDVELFAQCKAEWFRRFLELPNGIPCSDTFARVFARIDPDRFRDCFRAWVSSIHRLTQGQVIAVDGKTLRRSHDRRVGKEAIHMVSAWASENSLVLGQVRTDAKSNEITAIPELLKLLDVSGCIVSIDAMGCQKEIARTILERGADYLLAVKGNQGRLYDDLRDLFEGAEELGYDGVPHEYATTLNKGHGRIERRECRTISDPACLEYLSTAGDWPGLRSVGVVRSERREGERVSVECRYYISSLESEAQRFLGATRSHWGIENSVHWVLDVSFREDESRVRTGNAPQNMATMRHAALNLLRQDKHSKISIKARRKLAAWDNDYLLSILSN